MNSYTGRRKYKRIELEKWKYKEIVSPCITRFRVTQCDDRETSSLEWNIVAVKNLSAGGIMFNYYKMDLGFGSLLELKLDFIKSKPTISCIGRVVRIEDAHTNCMFRIATEFTEINDLDREIINTTVEAILTREAKKKIYPEKLLKMTNTLTRRLGIAEVRLEGSKIKTIPSVDMDDEFWTRIHTAPETLPLEESEMITGSVFPALRNGDIDGQGKQTEKPLEPNDVEGISVKNRIQEAKKAECEAELIAEREAKKAEHEAELKAEREAKKAEHEAELKAEREAKKAECEVELIAEREAKKAEFEAELKVEREAKKAEHEVELKAEREAKKTEYEAELKAEREAKQAECEAELKAERESRTRSKEGRTRSRIHSRTRSKEGGMRSGTQSGTRSKKGRMRSRKG